MTTRTRNHTDLAFAGTSEAYRWACPGQHPEYTRDQLIAINEARELFEKMTDEQMAAALLILLVDLGRRTENADERPTQGMGTQVLPERPVSAGATRKLKRLRRAP